MVDQNPFEEGNEEHQDELNDSIGNNELAGSFTSPVKRDIRSSIVSTNSHGSDESSSKFKTCSMIMLISGVRYPVTEKRTIWVQWSRGKKHAETAKKHIRPETN